MATSPSEGATGVLTVSITSDGADVDDTVQVVSIMVDRRVNRIPRATLVLADGDMPDQDFPLSASETFTPGKVIGISAGYGGETSPIFEGVVVKHGIRIGDRNRSTLVLECRDKAVAMTLARKNALHLGVTDGDVMSTLIGNHGLTADVAATTNTFEELVQYYCTDWDYVVSRAEVNGMLVLVDAGTVSVAAPDTSAPPVLGVTWGVDLVAFEAEMDARWARSSMKGVSWSPTDQAATEGEASTISLGLQGNIPSSTLASALTASDPQESLNTSVPLNAASLKAWAEARQTRAELARVQGRMTFPGSALAVPGALIELNGVGSRFNGNVFVGGVRHELSGGTWTTEVDFGMSPYSFAEEKDIMAPQASGWTPGISGLHIGVVKKLDANPAGEPMVQVAVMSPSLDGTQGAGVWARLTTFYASEGIGTFFVPEIGDEVVLGFLNDDPSFPVILGSVYSSKRAPPYTHTADNFIKALVTKSELKVEFDDENKVVTLVTPAGNTVVVSDKDKSILLQDQTGNKVEMSESGVVVDSPKDITLSAKGKISLSAVGNVELAAQADVKASGLNVSCEAQVGFTGKGSASAELSASGQTTVKGAMVMIN